MDRAEKEAIQRIQAKKAELEQLRTEADWATAPRRSPRRRRRSARAASAVGKRDFQQLEAVLVESKKGSTL